MPNKDEIIIITAARPGLWFKEKLNIKRWLNEKFVKDYGKTMDHLRKIDDAIEIWVKDIESIIKDTKKRFNQPGFMSQTRALDIAGMLGNLNRRFQQIEVAKKILDESNKKYLDRFEEAESKKRKPKTPKYDLSEQEIKELDRLKASEDINQLFATAGFWDDLKDKWISKRHEKSEDKERREAFESLVEKADSLTQSLKSHIKNLHNARAKGDVGNYIDILSEISSEQQDFETDLTDVHKKYIRETFEETALEKEYDDEPETLRMEDDVIQLTEEDVELIEESPELRALDITPETPTERGFPGVMDSAPKTMPSAELEVEPIVPTMRGVGLEKVLEQFKDDPESEIAPESELTFPGPEYGAGVARIPEARDVKPQKVRWGPKTKREPQGRIDWKKTEYNLPEERNVEEQVELIPETQPSPESQPFSAATRGPVEMVVESINNDVFIKKISSIKNEFAMAEMLIRYSEWYEKRDLIKSKKLLNIAESILQNV